MISIYQEGDKEVTVAHDIHPSGPASNLQLETCNSLRYPQRSTFEGRSPRGRSDSRVPVVSEAANKVRPTGEINPHWCVNKDILLHGNTSRFLTLLFLFHPQIRQEFDGRSANGHTLLPFA